MKSRDFKKGFDEGRFRKHGDDLTIFFEACHIMDFRIAFNRYNSIMPLNSNDQDSLNSTAGGNFLDKMPRDCLRIIESKSKDRNSCNKPVVAKVKSIDLRLFNLPAYHAPANQAPDPQIQGVIEGRFSKAYRCVVAYMGTRFHTTYSPKVVDREPEVTKRYVPPTNYGSTEEFQPPLSLLSIMIIFEAVIDPVCASKPNQKQSIYSSRRNDESTSLKKLTTK
ncbi:hypothetical protein Tco_0957120 [Tanacetum coccineum]